MQITYQKRDGRIIQRTRKTPLPYEVGESTSMGWKVLQIEYEYKNQYYPKYKYDMLLLKNKQKFILLKKLREICLKELKTLLYLFIVVIILYYIRIMIGI